MRLDIKQATERSLLCQRPLTRLISDHPHPTHGSLTGNKLCGVDKDGFGEYTTEGITALCTGLKGSAVTSLECAAAPSVCFYVSAP